MERTKPFNPGESVTATVSVSTERDGTHRVLVAVKGRKEPQCYATFSPGDDGWKRCREALEDMPRETAQWAEAQWHGATDEETGELVAGYYFRRGMVAAEFASDMREIIDAASLPAAVALSA